MPQISAKLGDPMTPREHAVCMLLTAGETAKGAARALGISHRTVQSHTYRIYQKLGVNSVVKLTRVMLTRELGKEQNV